MRLKGIHCGLTHCSSFVCPYFTEPSAQKSLVLTAEEFQRLTSQGILRFQPPKRESIQPSAQSVPVVAPTITCTQSVIPVQPSNGLIYEDKDVSSA